MQKLLDFSKFRQNFTKMGNFGNAFKILQSLSKFCHFSHFGENFASLTTLVKTKCNDNDSRGKPKAKGVGEWDRVD